MRLNPSGEGSFTPERHRQGSIEVCVKCLYTLRPAKDAAEDIFLFGNWWWICLDTEKCAERREENQEQHRKEIEHRLRHAPGRYTHLIVVQDNLGHRFGYGNCYVSVKPGEDMQEIAAKYSICADLVVEFILRVEEKS